MRRLLIVVTGSVAAYKIPEIIRNCEKEGYSVSVILTYSAKKFVTKYIIKSLTRAVIYDDEVFESEDVIGGLDQDNGILMRHISLAKDHDVIAIAPASANFIAKMAHGMADTLSLNVLLATKAKVIVFPAMNPTMFINNATQDNILILEKRGVKVVPPKVGIAACGDYGQGLFVDCDVFLQNIAGVSGSSYEMQENVQKVLYGNQDAVIPIRKRKAIITVGGFREKIDEVRFIGNISSGMQGLFISEQLVMANYDVVVVYNHIEIAKEQFKGCKLVFADSVGSMLEIIEDNFPADVFIGCAAVSDYKVKSVFTSNKSDKGFVKESSKSANSEIDAIGGSCVDIDDSRKEEMPRDMLLRGKKIKGDKIIIECDQNIDVIKNVANNHKRPSLVIGFSLESDDYINNSIAKLKSKSLDLVVVNQTSFLGSPNNVFHILEKVRDSAEVKSTSLGLIDKKKLAELLVSKIVRYFGDVL